MASEADTRLKTRLENHNTLTITADADARKRTIGVSAETEEFPNWADICERRCTIGSVEGG